MKRIQMNVRLFIYMQTPVQIRTSTLKREGDEDSDSCSCFFEQGDTVIAKISCRRSITAYT
jgi:hypothetical protein